MKKIDWGKWALPVLIVLSILLRFGTFFPSVINHDESTYILIGESLLEGDIYLQDSYDTKPIGIFLIYALMALLTGGSIFGMRLLTAVVIGITAWLLFLFGKKILDHQRIGWAAGLSYILICSIFKYYGLSPNTELFFLPFTIAAFLLAWPNGQKWPHYLLAGLLLGCGFMIKYVVAADALTLGLILLYFGWKNKTWVPTIFAQCLPMTLAFFIPMVLVFLYYQNLGLSEPFLFYTLEVTSKYPEEASLITRLSFIGEFLLRFFPLVLFAFWAYKNNTSSRERTIQHLLFLWLACDLIMILIPGKTFGHYQIQLMPMLCLLAALWFDPYRKYQPKMRLFFQQYGRTILMTLFAGLSIALAIYYIPKPDYPKQIATILENRLEENEKVYVGNYHHIVYHLLGQKPLTPYVHSSLLYYEHHLEALDIDLKKETDRILDQEQPRFVILREKHPDSYLTQSIAEKYMLTDSLPGKTLLFTRK